MNPEVANRSAIIAAQYAGSSDQMNYISSSGYLAAFAIVAILFIFWLLKVLLEALTKEEEPTWQEVNYDNRTMGEERSRDRDGQGTQGTR